MLREAGWNPGSLRFTNVFETRPRDNDLRHFTISSKNWKALSSSTSDSPSTTYPPPMTLDGKKLYLHPNLLPELSRLHQEIDSCNPNLILALGNTALWALMGRQNISSLRGTMVHATSLPTQSQRKILPTYHPAAVLRQWQLRPIVVADLMKARIQAEFPEIRRPPRSIIVNPSLACIRTYLQSLRPDDPLACDIETRLGQITEIGFAQSPNLALVVPFIKGFNTNYWLSSVDEAEALHLVKRLLQSPCPKLFQNGLFDLQYIWKTWHFTPRNVAHDTMLKHHALYPEVQKGLGFLGSLYTSEPAWKLMRNKRDTMEKADDE